VKIRAVFNEGDVLNKFTAGL